MVYQFLLECTALLSTSRHALPKAVQISEMLIRDIASGRLEDGTRLPTERAMARDLGIAVGTLRRALAILEAQDLLERVQGSGNYVRAKTDVQSVYGFFRLELIDGGGLPTASVLDVQRHPKPNNIPSIGDCAYAHRIRRLRYLSTIPVAVEEIWLDGRFADWLVPEDLSESLYIYYRKDLKLIIAAIKDEIGISTLPNWTPPLLNAQAGTSCGFVERLSYGLDGAAAEYSKTWFNAAVCRYTNRLGEKLRL